MEEVSPEETVVMQIAQRTAFGSDFFGYCPRDEATREMLMLVLVLMRIRTKSRWKIRPLWISWGCGLWIWASSATRSKVRWMQDEGGWGYVLPLSTFAF
jgi:hypothetical protein